MIGFLYISLPALAVALWLERRPRRNRLVAAARVAFLWSIAVAGCALAFSSPHQFSTPIIIAIATLYFFPAALWSYATVRTKWLPFRTAMHALANTGTLLVAFPLAVFSVFGGTWRLFFQQANWKISLWLHLIALAAVLGMSAIQEFRRYAGTPDPCESPSRLVRSGIYSYISNPMEVAAVLLILAISIVVRSLPMAAIAVLVTGYFCASSDRDERKLLARAFGAEWSSYDSAVRPWRFRWRPFAAPSDATLYIAQTCVACSQLGQWIARRAPVGLRIAAAEEHPTRALTRMTYETGDGSGEESGVAALARALEHIHLGWAFCGFSMRLPLLCPLIQVLVDASGGDERTIERCEVNLTQGPAGLRHQPALMTDRLAD